MRDVARQMIVCLVGALLWQVTSVPVPAQQSTVQRYRIDPATSTVSAAVAEPMRAIRGRAIGTFRVLSGEVQGDPSAIADTAQVRLTIDATSYASGNTARDQQVTESALEARQFPTITFESKGGQEVSKQSDRAAMLRIRGDLTLHGMTKPILVPVSVHLDEQGRLIADGTYTFKFEEYGVRRPSALMGLMVTGDEATVVFHIVARPL